MKNFLRKTPIIRLPQGWPGFAVYTLMLASLYVLLPNAHIRSGSEKLLVSIGFLGLWRYSWGLTHLIRSCIYRWVTFPRWRAQASGLMPSQIYLLITSYRVSCETTLQTIHASIKEAISCGAPVTIIASIVELADELLYKQIFAELHPPPHIQLRLVRIPGTGKRDALSAGFKAISRDMPPPDALVALVDGDTLLTPDMLRKCAPLFALLPNLGALTTDEICQMDGSNRLEQAWFNLRFAQRHILMSSLALSKRIMTLTGRMSIYRADIITDPAFIAHMTEDSLDHWRLGNFRFLTGDDKSSLYWVLKEGYEQLYVPDVRVVSLEMPPARGFFASSTRLMVRWFGNMMRTNGRVLRLGPSSMPFFVWWCFLDQRVSIWTTLTGPIFALMLTAQQGVQALLYYFAWVGFTRWITALTLLTARPTLDWRYPFLLFFNQIYGSLLKTWIFFRLDRQSWTRQKTEMRRSTGAFRNFSSFWIHATALAALISAVGLASGYMSFPAAAIHRFGF